MSNAVYTLKISPKGQLTLPQSLRDRLNVQPGNRVSVAATEDGVLQVSNKSPMAEFYGKFQGAWTTPGQDAADYARQLRNDLQRLL